MNNFRVNLAKNIVEYYGRKITSAFLKDQEILLNFHDGKQITIFDEAQSCCEKRYLSSDDDISELIGFELKSISAKNVIRPEENPDGDFDDIVFLEIQAGHITFTAAAHNEHNGYYGGFEIACHEVKNDS